MTVLARLFATAATAFSLAAAAGSASAATYVDPWTTSATGGISVVFGDNGLGIAGAETILGETTTTHTYDADTGAFTDTYSFELPTGSIGFTLSSIGFLTNSALTVSSFNFNGTNIGFTNTPAGDGGSIVMGAGGPIALFAGGPQVLTIAGNGGAQAVFSGTATFEKALPVPEPGAWALMILGFGGAGTMIRRRRGGLATA